MMPLPIGAIVGDTVWANVEDEDGAPVVRRYVIKWED
jgi:hypothetical protein